MPFVTLASQDLRRLTSPTELWVQSWLDQGEPVHPPRPPVFGMLPAVPAPSSLMSRFSRARSCGESISQATRRVIVEVQDRKTYFPIEVIQRLILHVWTMIFDFRSPISPCSPTHFSFRQICRPSPAANSRYFITRLCSRCKVSKVPVKHRLSVSFLFSPSLSRNDLSELTSSRSVRSTPCRDASSLTSCRNPSGASRATRKQL